MRPQGSISFNFLAVWNMRWLNKLQLQIPIKYANYMLYIQMMFPW